MPCLSPVFEGMVGETEYSFGCRRQKVCVCLSPGILPVAVYELPHPLKFIAACQTARLIARKSSMASFVWRAFLSMALLTLSVMIYACCNHSAPTAGASTPRSCFLLPDESMVCTNLSLEGRELNTGRFKVIAATFQIQNTFIVQHK